ncbi:unnamed protein product [Aphanomyces euteiches]
MERYTIEKVLSQALFGDVVLCVDTITGDRVAIKRMNIDSAAAQVFVDGPPRRVSEDISFEKHVNRTLQAGGSHANVVAMRDDFVQDGVEHFVFDYCPCGELFDAADQQSSQRMDAETVQRYFQQIVRGVAYIHSQGFAHRDLSLENVLLDENDTCRVCDFGLAAAIDTKHTQVVGKSFYMAPEVVSGMPYDAAAADVWSLGIMLFILITGAPLVEFADSRDSRFRFLDTDGLRELIRSWEMEDMFEPQCLSLVEQLLTIDPVFRPTIDEVVQHPYVSGESVFQLPEASPEDLKAAKAAFHIADLASFELM